MRANVKKWTAFLCACVLVLVMTAFLQPFCVEAAAPVYTVEFRAGNHGSFSGASKTTESRIYKETLNAVPEPDQIDSGYWFTGYDTAVETTVTESRVYVAQYARLINAVEYRVNYVDSNGVVLATQRTAYANEGETIHAYAPAVEGYTPDAAEKNAVAQAGGTTITFVYTLTGGPAAGVQPGGAGQNNAGGGAAAGADGAQDNAGGNLQPVEDEPVPQGQQQLEDGDLSEIEDEPVPLANNILKNNGPAGWVYAATAGVVVLIGGVSAFLIIRKKKKAVS